MENSLSEFQAKLRQIEEDMMNEDDNYTSRHGRTTKSFIHNSGSGQLQKSHQNTGFNIIDEAKDQQLLHTKSEGEEGTVLIGAELTNLNQTGAPSLNKLIEENDDEDKKSKSPTNVSKKLQKTFDAEDNNGNTLLAS